MAGNLWVKYPGEYCHMINRGGYRSWIFQSAGFRLSFLAVNFKPLGDAPSRLYAYLIGAPGASCGTPLRFNRMGDR